jgi:hypothetical protein
MLTDDRFKQAFFAELAVFKEQTHENAIKVMRHQGKGILGAYEFGRKQDGMAILGFVGGLMSCSNVMEWIGWTAMQGWHQWLSVTCLITCPFICMASGKVAVNFLYVCDESL